MGVRGTVAALVVALSLVGCGSDGEDPEAQLTATAAGDAVSAECEQAMSDAASVGEMQDSVSDLYPAVEACSSVDEWTAAGEAAGAFDGYSVGPEELLGNVCQAEEVADAPLCAEVG